MYTSTSTLSTAAACMQCYNISVTSELTLEEAEKLLWLLAETYEPERLTADSTVASKANIVEVGPRLSFSTAWSANAVSICESCGVSKVNRVEKSRRSASVSVRANLSQNMHQAGSPSSSEKSANTEIFVSLRPGVMFVAMYTPFQTQVLSAQISEPCIEYCVCIRQLRERTKLKAVRY